MRIKKYKNNQYVTTDEIWIRNPFKESKAVDINFLGKEEINIFIKNEEQNIRSSYIEMDKMEEFSMDNIIIVSDGYNWKEKQLILADLPNSDVKIIGVNGSLSQWNMVGKEAVKKRVMAFYIINNPYSESMRFLPKKHSYYPNIVSSTRTYSPFLKEYKTQPYLYRPTPDVNYSGLGDVGMTLDDYRNPICAAISFAVRRKAKKILLFCCDEAFEEKRPGSIEMKNGLYQYPQQVMCQNIIDKQCYWLKKNAIEIKDCSYGIKYENIEYINFENITDFFKKD